MRRPHGFQTARARELGISQQAVWSQLAKAEGRCRRCGTAALDARIIRGLCQDCYPKQRDATRQRLAARVAAGLCRRCGREPLVTQTLGKRCRVKAQKTARRAYRHGTTRKNAKRTTHPA